MRETVAPPYTARAPDVAAWSPRHVQPAGSSGSFPVSVVPPPAPRYAPDGT
ncbi:hypothetical protein [Hymenobacter rubripertinctus]|uniref:hypothetical protein n=1 Tax=Hymenobacter rubripertinctus TaxID=2029981 RepID=UPI001602A0F0|nr:hypothetical protein [Hymenobacter rubripertinctus]